MSRLLVVFLYTFGLMATGYAQVGNLPQGKKDVRRMPDVKPEHKGNALLLHLGFGFQFPGGDMADRFGNNGTVGLGLEFINKNNWIFGAEGHYLFGSDVKEDPLAILRTPEGDIIGNERQPADVFMRERGWYIGAGFGKLFPVVKGKRAGIRATLTGGWTQHKIRVQDDSETVTALYNDYIKGYDRLTGGFALNQFIGWQQFGNSDGWNFMLGFEFNQGFTNTLREWDFTEMRKLDEPRLDLRFGIRAHWILPFYIGTAEKIYY